MGQYFRRRYDKILGGRYSPNKVYIRSSDCDRAITSALANLAGMFPPTDDEIWNDNIPWQPIPVHTVPKANDYVIFGLKNCNYENAYEKYVTNRPEVQQVYHEYADKFQFWSEKSGKSIATLNDVYKLYSTLNIESLHGKL